MRIEKESAPTLTRRGPDYGTADFWYTNRGWRLGKVQKVVPVWFHSTGTKEHHFDYLKWKNK